MKITPEQIADLTDREQRNMSLWISEESYLSELSAHHRSRQTQAMAKAQTEHESPDTQPFAEPE